MFCFFVAPEYGPEEGSERLNRNINEFFDKMIKTITEHNGDIIKFAGAISLPSLDSFCSALSVFNAVLRQSLDSCSV